MANIAISHISDILPIDCFNDEYLDDPQPEIHMVKTMLSRNKNYFISWFGPNSKDSNRSKEFLTKPSNRKLVLETLLKNPTNPSPPRCPYEFEKYNPHCSVGENIAAFFVEAFILLANEKTADASKLIYMGKWFTEYCLLQKYIDADYLLGVKYLCRWLKLHVMVIEKKVSSKWRVKPRDENEYELLPDKSKAIVLAAKCYFLSSLRFFDLANARADAMDCLRSISAYDSENFIWNYRLANWLRFDRRKNPARDEIPPPGLEEMDRLWKAYDCFLELTRRGLPCNEITKSMALSGICQGLAEIVQSRSYAPNRNGPLQVGTLYFENTEDIVKFVLQKVGSINSNQDSVYPELIRAGEIVFNILPKRYRDSDLAEALLTRAWICKPANSKINHKLGLFYLSKNDFERSIKFFRNAIEYSAANFPATIDLIKTLMSSPHLHLKEIDEFFNSAFKQETFNSNERTQIQVIHGCFKFIMGAHDEAISIWLQTQKSNPYLNLFEGLNRTILRHKWSKTSILEEIKISLEIYLESSETVSPSDRTVLDTIVESIRIGKIFHNKPRQVAQQNHGDANWRGSLAPANYRSFGSGHGQPSTRSVSDLSDASLNRPGSYVHHDGKCVNRQGKPSIPTIPSQANRRR